jgi:hypothetical protein
MEDSPRGILKKEKPMTLRHLAIASLLLTAPGFGADEPAGAPRAFTSPEDAWKAFLEAMKSGDWTAVEALIGSDAAFLPPAARSPERLKKTAEELVSAPPKVEVHGEVAAYLVEGRPFPVGAKKTERGWLLASNARARGEQEAAIDRLHCLSNLKLLQLAASGFERKRKRQLATIESLTGPTAEPFLQPSVLLCPAVGEGKHRIGAGGVACDYFYLPSKAGAPDSALFAFCPKGNHPGGGRSCVFRDGTAREFESESEFRAVLKASLEAAGISLEPPKDGATPPTEDSPSLKPEWRKAILRELGLDGASTPDGQKPRGDQPGEDEPAGKEPGPGKP